MNPNTSNSLSNPDSWKRGAVMLLFFLLLAVATPLLMLVSLVGWVFLLVQGQVPEGIRDFGRSLASWFSQATRYLTGSAERRPFPFEDLDCPNDELPKSRAAHGSGAKTTPTPKTVSKAKAETEGQVPTPGKPAAKETAAGKASSKKSASKKASGKKAGGKKATKKKTSKKKVSSKKADEGPAASQDSPGKAPEK